MVSNKNQPVGPQRQGQGSTETAHSGCSDEVFQRELQNMKKATLNGLDMSNYTRPQRHLIDQERCRRSAAKKAAAANNQSTTLVPLQPPRVRVSLHPTSTNFSTTSVAPVSIPEPTTLNNTVSRLTSGRPRSYYLFPEHHDLIVQQVPGVHFKNEDVAGVYKWPTNILGAFLCSRKKCKKEWKSGVVATVIRGYILPGDIFAYNAQVFNQGCVRCESLGYMTIDRDVYIARVVRRLRIWRNEPVEEAPKYSKGTPPHMSWLCEGCKVDECPRAREESNVYRQSLFRRH